MQFTFSTASHIVYGAGALAQLAGLVEGWGKRALVVTGLAEERVRPLVNMLAERGIQSVLWRVTGEPDVAGVRQATARALDERCDLVIGFGGGSSLDAAKAVAALATNGGDVLDYLEIIGHGRVLAQAPLPCVAIPTTAGTGAEVTRNAVIRSPEHRLKVSLRSPLLLPRLALVDPELTYSLPPDVTAATGMDALTQVLEPYVSVRANPLTDGLCREGLQRAGRSLRRAYHRGDDAEAREDMAIASLFGGLALANAGLGLVHGFAAVLGGMLDAPHGALCARLLPGVMQANVRALRERQPESPALRRYDDVAALLTGVAGATAADGVRWVTDLCVELHIPRLSSYGLTQADVADVVEKAARASSSKANPIVLTPTEMAEVVAAAL